MTKMSKSIRATEDLFIQSSFIPNWHSLFAIINQQDPPCLEEFRELMKCSEKKKLLECTTQYMNLLHCLRKNGYDCE